MTSHEAFDFECFTGSENKYAILGVPQEASPEAIKKAFRRLAFLYHPDRHPGRDKQRAEDVFKRINAAYQTLADPVARRDYDRVLRRGRGASIEREPASGEIDPLAQILQEILRYRQIFSSDQLKRFNEKLRSMVSENLISDLGEQIVGIIPLSAPPEPFELKGDFKSGSMVLTNLRILLPFWSRELKSWGATMATFDYYSMPGVAFAELRQVKLRSTSRIFRALSVHLECAEKTIVLQPKHRNLGKLLLLCSLWGIPVLAEENVDKASDILDAIFELPSWVIAVYITLNFFALVVGLFLDGPIATVAGLNTALWERGILQIVIVAVAAGMGIRIRSALRTYGRASVSDLLAGRES